MARKPRALAAGLSACVLLLVASRGSAGNAQDQRRNDSSTVTLDLDAAHSTVHWTLGSSLHTVHGTFAMKQGSLQFDPQNGKASGEFVADATSGKSGNDGRDKKMHREILESAHYSDVIFRPEHVEGKAVSQGVCDVGLQGKILLHGSEHEIVVPVHAEITGDHWKGSAKFSVPYVKWGLKSPNTFFLKADPAVEIELELSGTVHPAAGP